MPRKIPIIFQFLLLCAIALSSHAEQKTTLKPFVPGSYQQLLDSNANKPFMLVIWSITCSSCLKDMALLNKMHKANPNINMVML
ncbi:MAG: hypothetical protein HOO93_18575, partial [Methyloglobulus sp.]|nr:hypothetical protein [Methyloglobulus sp.]